MSEERSPGAAAEPSAVPQSWVQSVRSIAAAVRREPKRVVAACAALAVAALVGWWLLRPPSSPRPELILPLATTAPPARANAGTGLSATVGRDIVVYVVGAVARPGVLRLPDGSRVIDALDAAGGAVAGAEIERINLAAKLSDGQRVHIPRTGEAVVADAAAPGASGDAPRGGPVDLNTANAAVLETLPGVGPATAAAIIEHRQRNGPFRSVDALGDVAGIGPAKLAKLRPLVTV